MNSKPGKAEKLLREANAEFNRWVLRTQQMAHQQIAVRAAFGQPGVEAAGEAISRGEATLRVHFEIVPTRDGGNLAARPKVQVDVVDSSTGEVRAEVLCFPPRD